jgi:hypothetical protein
MTSFHQRKKAIYENINKKFFVKVKILVNKNVTIDIFYT